MQKNQEFWAAWGGFEPWFATVNKYNFGELTDHEDDCNCETCLAWAAIISGPGEDETWGPFSQEEIDEFIKTELEE